jgi:hypothetical protein
MGQPNRKQFYISGSALIELLIKKAVDAYLLVIYDRRNTGKEVIQKYMSSYHSEVAAA